MSGILIQALFRQDSSALFFPVVPRGPLRGHRVTRKDPVAELIAYREGLPPENCAL